MNQRIIHAVQKRPEAIAGIVESALRLERDLYASDLPPLGKPCGTSLYLLRKSLEGIFGHNLPEEE